MEIRFQHWEYQIADEMLVRYGSPFFSRPDAGNALQERLLSGAVMVSSQTLNLQEQQIICANEAFPEAAVADPLADLQVWDEWETGHRIFPYPGRFSRLGLTRQEGKTSSPSSVGVLGEIFAGLFAQAYVAPQVLVRVIRHWPDLIFYAGEEVYAFVEAKAFTEKLDGRHLQDRVPGALLRELLCNAVAQLNADPHLEIWGSFTGVLTIQPQFTLAVTFLRLTPPPSRRGANPRKNLPPAVVRGVAERALAQATAMVGPDVLAALDGPRRSGSPGSQGGAPWGKRLSRAEVEGMLRESAMREAEEVLAASGPAVAVAGSREEIEQEVKRLVEDCRPNELHGGKRFFEIKQRAEGSVLERVRIAGDELIFMANLSPADLHQVQARWRRSWESAAEPLTILDGYPVWRGGGAAYCIGQRRPKPRAARLFSVCRARKRRSVRRAPLASRPWATKITVCSSAPRLCFALTACFIPSRRWHPSMGNITSSPLRRINPKECASRSPRRTSLEGRPSSMSTGSHSGSPP